MQKDLEVKSKGVSGKDDTPFIAMQGNDGTRLKLILSDESELSQYEIGDIVTMKFVKEQQKLG